jgi:hypothetical protein
MQPDRLFARVQMDGADHKITRLSVDICSHALGKVLAAAWRDLEVGVRVPPGQLKLDGASHAAKSGGRGRPHRDKTQRPIGLKSLKQGNLRHIWNPAVARAY